MDAHALALSLVVAVEPLPVLATVVLLTTDRGRTKALAFLVGWAVAFGGIALGTLALGGSSGSSAAGTTVSTVGAVADVMLGLVLGVVAIRRRPGAVASQHGEAPGWLARLDTAPPVAAAGLGLFLPPYAAAVAVGASVAHSSGATTAGVVAVLAFTAIACGGVIVPLLVTVARPTTAEVVLGRWRAWLVTNWPRVAFWLLTGLAVYLLARGVVALVG